MDNGFSILLERFSAAVEAGNGSALADLFAHDGVYYDTFYGKFEGREAITHMLEDLFWGDASAFLWDMLDPVFDSDRQMGYARWVFSYTSTMEDNAGKRVAFNGMSHLILKNGLIQNYQEVFSAGLALVQLDMSPARTTKILQRMVHRHLDDPEWARHVV
ncbi:MAG: nuclear transport factor 2 family protein [Pseudomonadota bacterium]|nr:nuclear transport factor 2 family protein [Pseudomonadota bacterium]